MVRPFVALPEEHPVVEWRPGVKTRLHTAGALGATALCVIEQWCEPERGAPTHTHFEVEEVVAVLSGLAEVWVDGETESLPAGGSVRFPAQSWHGFRNVGDDELHILAAFASAAPAIAYRDDPDTILEVGSSGERRLDPHRAIREARQGGAP